MVNYNEIAKRKTVNVQLSVILLITILELVRSFFEAHFMKIVGGRFLPYFIFNAKKQWDTPRYLELYF